MEKRKFHYQASNQRTENGDVITERYLFVVIFTLALLFLYTPITFASSSETIKTAEDAPLTIDSRNGLECDRVKQVCMAEGNVIVRKGPYEMFAKKALAFMRKNDEGKTEIRRVEAHQNVEFFGINGETATSDDAYFDMDESLIRLTAQGKNQVHAWKDDYVLRADDLDIHLKNDQDKKLQVTHIDADGHVALATADELITGDHAIYTPETNFITVSGNVEVNRSEGQLRGSFAQVNLDTKVSQVLKRPNVDSDHQVEVLVFPEKVKQGSAGKYFKKDTSE